MPVCDHDTVAIHDFESSLKHDVDLLRRSKGIPKSAKIFGYVFNIDTDEFTLMVEDVPSKQMVASAT